MYDTRECHPNARTRAQSNHLIRLDSGRHSVDVDSEEWRYLQQLVVNEDSFTVQVRFDFP